MARTTPMRLVELMVLKDDVNTVISFLGKRRNFQFQSKADAGSVLPSPSQDKTDDSENQEKAQTIEVVEKKGNEYADTLAALKSACQFLGVSIPSGNETEKLIFEAKELDEKTKENAKNILSSVDSLKTRVDEAAENLRRAKEASEEAHSFANLKVSFEELDHISFLSLRIGRIDIEKLPLLKSELGGRCVIVSLSDESVASQSKILVASSKRARFSLDSELKKFGFTNLEIPRDFKGIPDDVLESLKKQLLEAEKSIAFLDEEKNNFARSHEKMLLELMASFSVKSQIEETKNALESTKLIYRITGWLPESECNETLLDLDKITGNRVAVRVYKPHEVLSVISGKEKVPVQLKHGKIVGAFERLILSYGSPIYGSIDPTPLVAIFFTILFGIMFGDAGQGLVFLLLGILMAKNVVKVGGWGKFAPIFIAIGISSTIMGILTGEFFGNEEILRPLSRAITGLFGSPRDQILHLMPNEGKKSVLNMFLFFGFTVAVGFFINSIGIIVNIANQFALGRTGKAIFGKTGISGAAFFWYVVVFALRIALFSHAPALYDWVIIALTLFCTAFSEPLSRLVSGERPVLENGLGGAVIEGVVEVLETVISYLSSSISFIRVGAFALAHAVLGLIISTLTELAGVGGIAVLLVGNGIVVVLEGMIVAIQVIRLQYYEFFSKFFNETGREFKPFAFEFK